MIQRKQTLFLLLAVIACVCCLFMPVGSFMSEGMDADTLLYNIGIVNADAGVSISPVCLPLFLLMAIATILSLATIFLFKNRPLQMKLCSFVMLLLVLWCVYYALIYAEVVTVLDVEGTLNIKWTVSLPLVSIILTAMARIGVRDDERLVRAADRIR